MNFFEAVAASVVRSPVQEAYVLVGRTINSIGPADLSVVISNLGDDDMAPLDRIVRDYHLLPGDADKSVAIVDGVSGLVDVRGVVVMFSVLKVGESHWRVLFQQVDAGKLMTTTTNRIQALERQVHELQIKAQVK